MIKRLFEFVKDEFAKPWTSLALPERKTIAAAIGIVVLLWGAGLALIRYALLG